MNQKILSNANRFNMSPSAFQTVICYENIKYSWAFPKNIHTDVPESGFLKNENDDRRVMGQRLRPKDAHYHCITPQFQGALSLHAMYQTTCTMGVKPLKQQI